MTYSETGNVLFTHISRTGGTTIRAALKQGLPDSRSILGQHASLAEARPVLGEAFNRAFKFAIVRNPWERFVSWYALLGQPIGNEKERREQMEPDHPHWKGFDAFLESWSQEMAVIDGIKRPALSQSGQLCDREDRLLTDHVGRFEALETEIQRLFSLGRIPLSSLPRLNSSIHHPYPLYYSAFGRELVASVFREDVERFGYRFGEESPFR